MDFYDWMRQEQRFHVQKGYTPEHDDEHGQMHLINEVEFRLYSIYESGRDADAQNILRKLVQVGSMVGSLCDQWVRLHPELAEQDNPGGF